MDRDLVQPCKAWLPRLKGEKRSRGVLDSDLLEDYAQGKPSDGKKMISRERKTWQATTSAAAFLLLQLLSTTKTAAQQEGSSEAVGGRTTSSAIVVAVRSQNGEPLATSASALVRLYSSDGTPMGQVRVGNGGEASFQNIHPGSYFVEVEAFGYVKMREDATLPLAGQIRLQIYLQPESKTEPVELSTAGAPILAPKPKKELEEGREALRKNDLDAARRHLEKAAGLAPQHPDVLYALASLNLRAGDLSIAEGLLKQTVELYPKDVPAQMALGIVLTDEGKFEAASSELEAALGQNAQAWEGRWALARCYYHQKKFELALAQSRRALEASKGQAPEVAMVLAASLTALGHYEKSAEVLRKFLEEHPNNSEAVRARRWLAYLKQSGKIA